MKTQKFIQLSALALGVALVALQGCATHVSREISPEGVPKEVVFPKIDNAWLKEGTFPSLEALRAVAPGMTKDQLYDSLGRPHFSEGMGGVREWDYIFNFRSGGGVTTCQYKAVFDQEYRAQSFYWLPSSCANMLDVRVATPVHVMPTATPKPAVMPTRVSLSADALFAFGKSDLKDLQPKGRRELDQLADKVRESGQLERLDVIGYTDRLGSDSYNQQLSQARANSVRSYLVSNGLAAEKISAKGMGKRDPLVECTQKSKEALITCLAPNRRVELAVQMLSVKN